MTRTTALSILFLLSTSCFAEETMEVIEVNSEPQLPALHKYTISADELTDSAALLSDVIASLPSVQIRKADGVGGLVTVSIRGSSSQQVNLYIDGQLVNSGQSGRFDLEQLPLAMIESIEMTQSQTSGVGPTPIGGEIRITTRRDSGQHTKATLAVGSEGYLETSVSQALNVGKHQLSGAVNYLTSDNDYEYKVPQSFTNSQVSVTEPLRNNQFEKLSLFLSDDWQQTASSTRFALQYNNQTKHIPNFQNNSPENNRKLEDENTRFSVKHNVNQLWSSTSSLLVDAFWFQQDEMYLDEPSPEKSDVYDYSSQQSGLMLQMPMQWQSVYWQPYVNFEWQEFESNTLVNQQKPSCNGISQCDVKAQQTQLHLGHAIRWQDKTKAWQVNWSVDAFVSETENQILHQKDINKVSGEADYFTQQFSVDYHQKDHRYSAQLSRGIRTPTMYELFGDRGSLKGNDGLKPEFSTSLSVNSQHFYNNWTLQQSVFYQQVEDSIVAIFNARGVGSYDNVSEVSMLGWSGHAQYAWSDVSVGGSIDLLNSSTSSEFRAFDNKKQPGVYHQQLNGFVQWQINSAWSVRFESIWDAGLYYDRANNISSRNELTSDRQLSNFSVSYDGNYFTSSFHIKNLFNQSYLDLANREAAGQQIRFSITIKEF